MSAVESSAGFRPACDPIDWELAAQAITVRIRWFGICVGYALVYFSAGGGDRPVLYAILALGALYALLDAYYSSWRREVFLSHQPLDDLFKLEVGGQIIPLGSEGLAGLRGELIDE